MTARSEIKVRTRAPALHHRGLRRALEVYALAIDGWRSYLGNDAADNRASALAPI
jgi:hypothetical protein